jgi:Secretion system C-terminal sorting domain
MFKYYLQFIFLFFFSHVFSQVNIQWEARYNNSSANNVEQAKALSIDNAGNVYTAGTSFNGTSYDAVLVKYNSIGTQQWIHTYNGAFDGFEEIIDLKQDASNNTYICGVTQVAAGDYDIFVRKIDPITGFVLWNVVYSGTPNYDLCKEMKIDNAGNVYIVGGLTVAATNLNLVVLKIEGSSGTLMWQNILGPSGVGRDIAKTLTIDATDNVYIAAETRSVANALDIYIIKYNGATGAIIWQTAIDGYGFDDTPEKIVLDNLNNVIVTGTSFKDILQEEDVFTAKLNSTGALQWKRNFSGTGQDFDSGKDVKIDPLNNIYVIGRTKGISTAEDLTVLRYRPDGNLHWNFRYPSAGAFYDEGNALTINNNFEIFAGGYTFSTATNNDYLTLRLDTLGTMIWSTKFDGTAHNSDQSVQSIFDTQGNVFVAGTSKGLGTNKDLSTIKYCQYSTQAGVDLSICAGESVTLNGAGVGNYIWGNVSGTSIISAGFTCVNCTTPSLTPTTTSVYTLSSVNLLGCLDFDTVKITVNSLPVAQITPTSQTTFCEGDSVTLTSTLAVTYDWSTGQTSQSITIDSTAVLNLTLTDVNNCQNTTTIVVIENPYPVVNIGVDDTICAGTNYNLNPTGALNYQWQNGPGIANLNNPNQIVNPFTNFSYVVAGTNSFGCTDTDTVLISTLPNPIVDINLSNFSSCPGIPAALVASGATTYLWNANDQIIVASNASQSISPTQTTTYVVTGTAFNGCSKKDSVTVTILADPTPVTLTLSTANTTISSNVTTNIEWYLDGLATGITTSSINYSILPFYPDGSYYVVHSPANGCNYPSNTIAPTADLITEVENGFLVYPNPTEDFFTVTSDLNFQEIMLMDQTGKVIYSNFTDSKTTLIDLSAVASGMYTLVLKNKEQGNIVSKKIIKK